MECEKEHQHHDHAHHRPKSHQECLDDFGGAPVSVTPNSADMSMCPMDWDPVNDLCWPPTAAGSTASLPCPDKPDINTLHNACRQCLFNGTWFVDLEQQRRGGGGNAGHRPFTNYHDCFVFEEEEYRMKMEAMIGKDTLLIHETLSRPEVTQYWLHGVSLLLTGVGLLVWISVWLHRRNAGGSKSKVRKYRFMILSYLALMSLQSVSVLYSVMHYHNTLKCYVFRMVHTFIESSFYTLVLFYCLDTTRYVSGVTLSLLIRRISKVASVLTILVITCLEGWIEIDLHPPNFCAFGIYLNPFHWTILWIKLSINGTSFTLICVSLFGLCHLKIPQTASSRVACAIKQNMSLLIVWIFYCWTVQFSPIFVYHMQKLKYSFDEIIYATRVYANLVAASGIVFTTLTCFFDLEVLVSVLPFARNSLDEDDDDDGNDALAMRVKVIKADPKVSGRHG